MSGSRWRLDLRSTSRENEITYGPVQSRRLGCSLGINLTLFSHKTCTYDCVYCQYGRTLNRVTSPASIHGWISPTVILNHVKKRLLELKTEGIKLDSITFSGYGESTLYPDLKSLLLELREIRDALYPKTPIRILTNSSLLHLRLVYEALTLFDFVIAKLDAGRQETFMGINRPFMQLRLTDIVEKLAELQRDTERVVIQILIFKSTRPDKPDNFGSEEISCLIDKIGIIEPLEVQLYTVDRHPSEDHVASLNLKELQLISERMNKELSEDLVKVYYA